MKTIKVILIGAGGRGKAYTDVMEKRKEKFQVVGVAEPVEDRRSYIQHKHNISEAFCFDTWEKILQQPKFADIAIISTMDRDHTAPALKALELGYDLLLEKPAAPTPEECVQIMNQAKKYGRKVMVCHLMRYNPFFRRLKKTINSGVIGDVVSIVHNEDVGAIHQSHSFVRGNWGNSQKSSFMLLQKSCHDMDFIQWLLDKECKKIQSFGSLRYFKRENAPQGSPEYCIEGCPNAEECMYNAVKLYAGETASDWFKTASTKMMNPSQEDLENAIRTTQYGKCVFKCDNDVVDHQVVNMEFEDDTTVTFTMCAFSSMGRTTKIMGTKGFVISGINYDHMNDRVLDVYDLAGNKISELEAEEVDDTITDTHGGGDAGIVDDLYDYITGKKDASEVSEIEISCNNHMLAFAAEKSRLEGIVVDVNEYRKSFL